MNLRRVACAVVAVFCTFAGQFPAAAHPHKTTVDRVDFHGWHDAYRISNGIVDVVVVPSIGRIMQYCFTGHPETSPIWINPAEEGKPAGKDWTNFGGDKVWPAPQGDWGKYMHQDRNWPPDPAIDPGRYTLTRIKNGVRLTGTPSKAFGIRITREIALEPGTSQVEVTDIFARPKDAKTENLPIAIWDVTQTRGDEQAYLFFNPASKLVPGGYVAIDEGTPKPGFVGPNWRIGDRMLSVTARGIHRGNKVGVDDTLGLVQEIIPGPKGFMFEERFPYKTGGPYLDNGTNAQVYANDNPAYIEIEAHSPGRKLKPGESMRRTVTWDLLRPIGKSN